MQSAHAEPPGDCSFKHAGLRGPGLGEPEGLALQQGVIAKLLSSAQLSSLWLYHATLKLHPGPTAPGWNLRTRHRPPIIMVVVVFAQSFPPARSEWSKGGRGASIIIAHFYFASFFFLVREWGAFVMGSGSEV